MQSYLYVSFGKFNELKVKHRILPYRRCVILVLHKSQGVWIIRLNGSVQQKCHISPEHNAIPNHLPLSVCWTDCSVQHCRIYESSTLLALCEAIHQVHINCVGLFCQWHDHGLDFIFLKESRHVKSEPHLVFANHVHNTQMVYNMVNKISQL